VRLTRDIVIIIAVLSFMVSSTAAWMITDQGEYTTNFVEIMDSPLVIQDKDLSFPAGNPGYCQVDVTIYNNEDESHATTALVQLVDSNGDLLYSGGDDSDPTSNYLGGSVSQTIASGGTEILSVDIFVGAQQSEIDGYVIQVSSNDSGFTSRLEKTDTDVVTASESNGALITYRSSDTSYVSPKSRFYTSSWQSQSILSDAGDAVRIVRSDFNTKYDNRDQAVSAVLDSNGILYAYNFDGTWWTKTEIDDIWSTAENIRPFDIEYEEDSGYPLIAYSNKDWEVGQAQVFVKRFDGTTWDSEASLTISGAGKVKYVKLVAKPDSVDNTIAMLVIDENNDAYVALWSESGSSSWGSSHKITDATYTTPDYLYERGDLAWQYDSSILYAAVTVRTTADPVGKWIIVKNYNESTSTWSYDQQWNVAPAGIRQIRNFDNRFLMLRSHRDLSSNQLALLLLDSGNDVWVTGYIQQDSGEYWWVNPVKIDGGVNSGIKRCIDLDWAPQGEELWVFAGDGAESKLSYKVFEILYGTFSEVGSLGRNVWYTYTYTSTMVKDWVQVRAVPYIGTTEFFVTTLDANTAGGEYDLWVTSVPAGVTIENDPSFTSFLVTEGATTPGLSTYESFDVAWTRYSP